MFQRIRQYELIGRDDQWYRPRAYSDFQSDGMWEGWLVFFPLSGGPAIATNRETTQPTYDALVYWATGITPTYLEGALDRALELDERPPVIAQLEAAEYEALEEASLLDAAAESERVRGAEARADADALREERLATEEIIAAADETEAKLEASVHERAAKDARAAAADAATRRRTAGRRRSESSSNQPTRHDRSKPKP